MGLVQLRCLLPERNTVGYTGPLLGAVPALVVCAKTVEFDMSESQKEAFDLAVASVSMETDKLTDEMLGLIVESIVNDWSTAEVVERLFS